VATILVIFLRINLPNFVPFNQHKEIEKPPIKGRKIQTGLWS